MKEIKREWDTLSKEERNSAIENIIAFYVTDRGEEMDIIGAGDILDFFIIHIAPVIYNKAIEDARELFKKQSDDTDLELNIMKKE